MSLKQLGAGLYQKPIYDGLHFKGRGLPCSHVLFDIIEDDGEENARVDPADIHVFFVSGQNLQTNFKSPKLDDKTNEEQRENAKDRLPVGAEIDGK